MNNWLRIIFAAVTLLLGSSVPGGAQDLAEVPEVPVETKDLLEVMGVSVWSMKLDFKAGTNSQLNVYAKLKAEDPVLLVGGPVIRNDGGESSITKRVLITVDGLLVQPHQEKLRVGIGAFDHATGTSTKVVANPMPEGLLYIVERLGFCKDSHGRVVLAKAHEKTVTAVPMVNDTEYTIYLAIEPWAPKK